MLIQLLRSLSSIYCGERDIKLREHAQHGASRFDNANSPNNDKILNRAGFYLVDQEGLRRYMVLTEVYKNELCKGFDQRTVTRVLLQAGWIKPAPDGKASHKPRIKGVGTPRLYVFTTNIWGGE